MIAAIPHIGYAILSTLATIPRSFSAFVSAMKTRAAWSDPAFILSMLARELIQSTGQRGRRKIIRHDAAS